MEIKYLQFSYVKYSSYLLLYGDAFYYASWHKIIRDKTQTYLVEHLLTGYPETANETFLMK